MIGTIHIGQKREREKEREIEKEGRKQNIAAPAGFPDFRFLNFLEKIFKMSIE